MAASIRLAAPQARMRETDSRKLIPPLAGALLKNEQDLHLFERIAFMSRRKGQQ